MKNRILWAVDPFCEDCTLTQQTARAVRLLAQQWNAEVEPIYLMTGYPPNVTLLPFLLREAEINAEDNLRRLLRGISIPKLMPLRIIENPAGQLREQVNQLNNYARECGANLIAVGTRARKGLKRWLLGSFAETLILRSEIPLYVINPQESTPRRIRHILFPTDFSKESETAFQDVIQFAHEINAAITVFHKIRYEITPGAEVAFGAYAQYRGIFEQEVRARQEDADAWAQTARDQGVPAGSTVEFRMGGSILDSLLRENKKRGGDSGIIAMAAHSGPLASALLGSVTRQVIRSSTTPVWVVHPRPKAKKTRGRAA